MLLLFCRLKIIKYSKIVLIKSFKKKMNVFLLIILRHENAVINEEESNR